nr:hypothetical protein [Tanacetum cinerariifolium]
MSFENGVNPPAPNPSTNSNFTLLLVLRRERLTDLNYMDWMQNLRFTLRYENKEYVLDEQIPTINDDSTQAEIKAHQKHYDDENKVSCIMASSMSPELQKTFENTWAYEMNQQLIEMFPAKASKERLDVIKSLMACKPKPRASICAFVLEMKGYFDRLESLNMVFYTEISINMILSGLPADYNQFKGKATQGKSDRGSKRKVKSKIAPTSDPKKAVCFYCDTKGHWKRSCPKYPKDLIDGKVEKGVHSATKDGKHYYVSFTDDFSRYGYVYLIKHKLDTFKAFKRYQNKVEKQLGRKIKLAPPITPQLNGVTERRNRTLLDMVSKTPFETWKGKRPSLGHIKIWGCEDNMVFVARRGVFLEREMICNKDSRSKIDLEEIQESADEEPIINTDTQLEVVTHVEPDDISLPIRRTTVFNDYEIWHMDVKTAFLNGKLIEDVFMAQLEGNDIPTLQSVKDWLGRCFAMKALGDAAYILGIKIYKDRTKHLIGLSQDAYLDKILKRFRTENSKKGNLPLHHGIRISKDLCPKTDDELDKISRAPYASAIGSIMYAMMYTRHDVSSALSMVSRHQQNPGEGHLTVVKNILRYLRNTKDMFLVYGGEKELRVTGYCDAGCSKQDTLVDSMCESEYTAACEASKKAIWMKNFIRDLGVVLTVQDPIEIFCDNKSVVALTKEPKDHEKSKNIERKYHFVRSKVEEGHVIVKNIQSDDNPADPFTKALAKSKHDEHAKSIGL